MKRCAFAALCLAFLLRTAAGGGVTLNLPWTKGSDDALKQAGDGKKPIAVCFIQNTCKLSMYMVKALHDDGRIYKLTSSFVWLCVDPTRKDDFKWFVGKCGDAVEATPTMFFLNSKGDYADPALAGIEPARGADPDVIIAAMRAVLSRLKQDIAEADKAEAQALRREAESCAKDAPGKAIRLHQAFIKAAEGWQSQEEAVQSSREEREKLIQEGMQKVRAALGRKATPEELAAALKDLAAAYQDSPVAAWAALELGRIKLPKGK